MSKNIQTSNDALILSKGVVRVAGILGIDNETLGLILSVESSKLESLLKFGIKPNSEQGEKSLIFIDVFSKLAALSGGDESYMNHFMQTESKYFEAKPIDIIKTTEGLKRVHHYLIAMGAKY